MRRAIAMAALGGLLLLVACGDGGGPPPGGEGGGGGSGGAGGTGGGGGSGGTGGEGGTGGSGGSGGEGGTGGEGGNGGTGGGGTGGSGGAVAETGTIEGRVEVEGGGDAAGVRVVLEGPDGLVDELAIDSSDVFRFAELQPGEYRLEASHPGYWADEVSLSVARGRTSRASLRLGRLVFVGDGRIQPGNVIWSPAGDRLVMMIEPRTSPRPESSPILMAWDDTTGRALWLPAWTGLYAWGGTFSPDGRFAAVYQGWLSKPKEATLVDFEKQAIVSLGAVDAFRFTPDSRWLVHWSEGAGPVLALNLEDRTPAPVCANPVDRLFSTTGPLLCLDEQEGWIRWDPTDRSREVLGISGPRPLATSAGFERGLFPGPAANGLSSHRSLALWRRGQSVVQMAESAISYRLVGDLAHWIDEGPIGNAGSLVRADLVTAETRVLRTGIDAFIPAAGGEQLFAFGDLPGWEPGQSTNVEGLAAPLDSWNGMTWTPVADEALYAYAGRTAVVSLWPAIGLFLAPDGGGGATLHLHRFADGTTEELAGMAGFAEVGNAGVAYLHDGNGTTRNLSVIYTDGTPPVSVLAGERLVTHDNGVCFGPRFSASLDRALLTVDCGNGSGELVAWDRVLGLRRLGKGSWLGTEPSGWPGPAPDADRIPYRRILAAGSPVGELHVFDFVSFTDRTVGEGVLDGALATLETVAFRAIGDDGTHRAFAHDPGTGLTVDLVGSLPSDAVLDVSLGVPGSVAVRIRESPGAHFEQVWIRPPGGLEALPIFRRAVLWPYLVLPVDGQPGYWVQLDELVGGAGRLVVVELPGFETTELATGVTEVLVDWTGSRIAYHLQSGDGVYDEGRPLYVTSLDELGPTLVAERVFKAVLTSGAVIYEENTDQPGVYALRLAD